MQIIKFSVDCGPINDTRTLKIILHPFRKTIGVLISGGLDSALLYYLLRNLLKNTDYNLVPFYIRRTENSEQFALHVVEFVNKKLDLDNQLLTYIDIDQSDTELEVNSGLQKINNMSYIKVIYLGLIQTLPEHALNVSTPILPLSTEKIVYPFRNLNKSHIVDLIFKLNLEKIFEITHSCVYNIQGRCNVCNRCNERRWAFQQLNKIDTGIL